MTDPRLTTTCPACNAKPGQFCTTPTNTGRRDVTWTHVSRRTITVNTLPPLTGDKPGQFGNIR